MTEREIAAGAFARATFSADTMFAFFSDGVVLRQPGAVCSIAWMALQTPAAADASMQAADMEMIDQREARAA